MRGFFLIKSISVSFFFPLHTEEALVKTKSKYVSYLGSAKAVCSVGTKKNLYVWTNPAWLEFKTFES